MRFWPSSSCSSSRPRPGFCGEARSSAAGCFGRRAWWRAGPCSCLPPPGLSFFHGGAWRRSGSTASAPRFAMASQAPSAVAALAGATSGIRASRSGNTGASRRPLSAISTARTSGAASSMARCNWRQPPPARATMLAGNAIRPAADRDARAVHEPVQSAAATARRRHGQRLLPPAARREVRRRPVEAGLLRKACDEAPAPWSRGAWGVPRLDPAKRQAEKDRSGIAGPLQIGRPPRLPDDACQDIDGSSQAAGDPRSRREAWQAERFRVRQRVGAGLDMPPRLC
ncbi:hypothetical protein SAMN04488021_10346 [Paracoccus aminovorans]|uniref:Uncharacterized protein n=1 Tax=Paracoccus aminovorans TaxID=34004 RepID=A0A1I2Y472_9RHOB|nr:hypothetical protein JCM7685_1513 [Paracoccus aminovorans]SFH20578.1 hypothetical protein SAMN04488021_10346 [Paracoccus aminovorans]